MITAGQYRTSNRRQYGAINLVTAVLVIVIEAVKVRKHCWLISQEVDNYSAP